MLHEEPAMPDGRESTASLFLTLAGAVSATLERSWQLLFNPGLFVQWLLARRRPGFVVACAIASPDYSRGMRGRSCGISPEAAF